MRTDAEISAHRGEMRLAMHDIRKAFGSTVALAGVSLGVGPGEVLALVGENGAGKSTLLKTLSGAHAADAGSMMLDGVPFTPRSPHDARRLGVAMVYQELSLAPHLTVLENILLGMDRTRFGVLRKSKERVVATRALERTGHVGIRLDARVRNLSPAERQVVEIARALAGEARVLILDEPTSSLTAADVRNLFRVIREVRSAGVSVIYVSHFLEEVREVADRVVVLRDGRSVGEGAVGDLSESQIIRWMVGREMDELFPRIERVPGEILLEVDSLSGVKLPTGVSFTVRRGEILGIAGLVGSGRSEMLRALFGLDAVKSGTVRVAALSGVEDLSSSNSASSSSNAFSPRASSPRSRWSEGVGMVSEDRKEEGLALPLSIADNLTLTRLAPYTRWGMYLPWKRREAAREWADRLGVVCRDVGQPISSLSGGNQQKVAFGRLLHHDVDLFLLDEPTRGIDVGSKAHLYRLIGESAAAGKAVVMVSSYLPELLGVTDRLAVMRRGVLSEPRPTSEWTEDEVMRVAVG